MDESDQMNRSPFGPAQFQKGFGGISPHRNSTGPVARKRKFPVLVSLDSQQVATSGRFGGGRRLESKKRPNTSRALEVEAIAKSFSNSYGQIHGSSLGEIQRRQAAVWCHHIQTCRGKGVRAAGTRVSTKPSCKRFWEAWQVEQEEGMVEAEEIGLRRNNGGGSTPLGGGIQAPSEYVPSPSPISSIRLLSKPDGFSAVGAYGRADASGISSSAVVRFQPATT
jgi:hypothetical protein